MELYTLNDDFTKNQLVEGFTSLVWTDRFNTYGDFQLDLPYTAGLDQMLAVSTYLSLSNTNSIMQIQTGTKEEQEDGSINYTVVGTSLEDTVLGTRPNTILTFDTITPKVDTTTDTDAEEPDGTKFTVSGAPKELALNLAKSVLSSTGSDKLTTTSGEAVLYTLPSGYIADTITVSATSVDIEFDVQSLYDSLASVCSTYGMGFRLVAKSSSVTEAPKLYFNVYSGVDRTSVQTAYPPIIFGPEFGNLSKISELSSNKEYRNIAYVISKRLAVRVHDSTINADSDATNFDRKVITTNITNTDNIADTDLQAYLEQKGQELLARQRNTFAIDGEVPSTDHSYVYNQDYFLGDLVEMRGDNGAVNRMRVTEQIFSIDSEGEKSYPTLELDTFVLPGTWQAWDINGYWDTTDGTWDSLT